MIYWQSSFASLSPFAVVRRLVCVLGLVFIPGVVWSQASLQAGSTVSREIAPAESHLFKFTLQRDQIIDLTVSAQDLNLRMDVVAPDGNTLAQVVHRHYGSLTWNLIAPQTGEYQLVVRSLEQSAPSQQYQLKVNRVTAATEREKKDAAAVADFQRAEVLRQRDEGSDLTTALEAYHLAAIALQRRQRWADTADTWQQIGEVNFSRGNYQEALRSFDQALQMSRKAGDVFLTITQEVNIGYVYIYLADFEKAATYFHQGQEKLRMLQAESAMQEGLEAQLQNGYGEIENGRGKLKESLVYFARALAQWEKLGDRRGMALAHLNSGFSHLDSGSVNEAAVEFDRSLKLAHEIADWRTEARALTARGNLYTQWGNKYAALSSHREAREIFRRIGDLQGEAVTSNGLGKVFEDLNRKQEAIDEYSLALRLNHTIGNTGFEGVSAYYLGRVSRDLNDLPKALEYYHRSLDLSRRSGKSRIVMLALVDVAGIYVKQHKFDEAMNIYRQSLAFYEQIGDLHRQALIHHGFGELLTLLAQPDAAIREYQTGLDLFQQIKDPQGQAESLYHLAKLSQEQGRLSEALEQSQKSVALVEMQRERVIGQNWRSSYFASMRRHFELCVDILMQLDRQRPNSGFAGLALETSERAKARSLLEMLTETQTDIRRGVDSALLAKEYQLRQQLSAKAAYQIKTLNSPQSQSEVNEVELEIRNLNREYDFVEAQIKAESPFYAQLIQPSSLTLKQLQASLRDDSGTVLLEYMLGDERSYVWLVTATGLVARELPGRQKLEPLTRQIYQGLTAHQQQPEEDRLRYQKRLLAAEKRFCPTAAELSQILLGPLMPNLNARRLLVVADGGLQYVPFDALPLPGADGSPPVCDLGAEPQGYAPLLTRFEVVNEPSFSSLTILRNLNVSAPRPDQQVAVWADPVFESDDPRIAPEWAKPMAPQRPQKSGASALDPVTSNENGVADPYVPPARLLATEEEAQSIMRLAPGGVSLLLTGFSANRESAVNRDLHTYRILHFATHGLINSRYPSLTGLLLSTVNDHGETQNGFLQLHDIYGLHLNADLVVLSGCQTGLGEELSGEGLVGLTQGFLYAGSRSVVVSLWDVQDKATATLMADFYRSMLKDGAAPAEALRQAKLKMYQQGPSPYYWAAFVIEGEYRPPAAPSRNVLRSELTWEGLALFGIVAWLSYSWWKRRQQAFRFKR